MDVMAAISGDVEPHFQNRDILVQETIHDKAEKAKEKKEKFLEMDINLTPNSENSKKITNNSQFTFDNVVGHLEDMLIDENFHKLQNSFLEKYWQEFEDNEENKHSYMPIFNEYTNQIEDFITSYLQKRIENFEMDQFVSELEEKKDNLEGEVFEVLLTLSDFSAFKEIFLDYRAMKEGRTIDLHQSLNVSSVPL